MTDLKELIEREIDQYLEWPTDDKSHVTTVSAKLFAGHVARLYADHITGAGKMAAPAAQGKPTDAELLDWAGEEQFFLFCDKDDFLDIARSVLQRYVGRSPAVQGEPVATIHVDGSFIHVAWRIPAPSRCAMDVYTAPQPAEQQPAPDVAGLVEAMDLALEYWRDRQQRYKNRRPKWVVAAESALAAHRKQQGGEA